MILGPWGAKLLENMSKTGMESDLYKYDKQNVVKVIIQNAKDGVLLIKESVSNEWMSGHWGLPGGKVLEKESLLDAFRRKMRDDLGSEEIKPEGLLCVQELLMEKKTVMMYHFIVRVEEFQVGSDVEIAEWKWFLPEDIEKMKIEEFTEFFNREMLLDFLREGEQVFPSSVIKTRRYYLMGEDEKYNSWFRSGKNK
jgi:ADP-ribose pyrophosphatase YjhB (NUDIX family)